MTLVMTQVAPWAILQCSDCRNTEMGYPRKVVDDWSSKHVSLHTQDGVALISYTGIGAFTVGAKRVIMSDWVSDTLHGAATTLFQAFDPAAHIFSIGAFAGDEPCYLEIHNIAGYDTNGKPYPGTEFVI